MKRDYYEVLGVSPRATLEEIKQAYRGLARQYHPDVSENKQEAEVKFKEINEAFSILSNSEKRAKYDQFGHAAFEGGSGGNGINFDFSTGFDMFDDLIGAFFGEGTPRSGRSRTPLRGEDIRYDLEITLEEAYAGVEKEISVKIPVPCQDCSGTGANKGGYETCSTCRGQGQIKEVHNSFFGRMVRTAVCSKCHGMGEILKDPCHSCAGTGVIEGKRKIKARIPAGVDEGTRIRIKGEGAAGFRGSPPGDLYLFIFVKSHPQFKREGLNIICYLSISFPAAVLGAELEVPTLDGKEKLEIPPGTQNGAVFRLRGKGMSGLNGMSRGDQMVLIEVEVPRKINDRQKELLQEFAKISGVNLNSSKGFMGKLKDVFGGS